MSKQQIINNGASLM